MKFSVYSWMIQSLYTAYMWRIKLQPLNWELIEKPHMEKFPTKHHVEVIWILHCMQHLIWSKLYQMMTWLYSTGILPVHKETTIQPLPLIPSALRSTRNQMIWTMSLKIHSVQSSVCQYTSFSAILEVPLALSAKSLGLTFGNAL